MYQLKIIFAMLTSGFLTLVLYPKFISYLKLLSFGQEIRDDGPKDHMKKRGTPTMGGLLLIIIIIFSCLILGDLTKINLWLLMYVLVGFGLIGMIDDLKKIRKNNSRGLSAKGKLFWQCFVGLSALIIYQLNFPSIINLFGVNLLLPVWLYLILTLFIIVGTSNAVNLTDGLDGLAIGPVIISSAVFLILSSEHEISVFCGALIGASAGFLWYNTYPAQIFMGDTGSLALGGALAMLAIVTKNELISAVLHGVFLCEALSVIIQVASFKLRKKRIFKMAPIHHHFELIGWAEPKIIVRFWLISIFLGLLTLVILKI